jgi:thiol-disulfide isomerase/thioredoxin
MVYFWATWCEPCREEYPMLVEVARQYAPKGLVVFGISLDEDAEVTLARRFLERNRPDFPNYRKRPGNEEAFINAVDPKWTGAIPATFFYSRAGREVGRLIGEHKREEFERAIQALLEPDAKSSFRHGARTGSPGH